MEIKLTDKAMKKHFRITFSSVTGCWEMWESIDKINWKKLKSAMSLEEVMKEKEKMKNKNIINLWNLITKRR